MKITRVVGIDVSLTSTGIAHLHIAGGMVIASTVAVLSKGHRGDTLAQRHARMRDIRGQISDWLYGTRESPTLTVIEGPSYGSTGGSAWDRAGLWWRVAGMAMACGPVAVVAPTTRAKWATGKGNADKAAVAAAMARYAPAVDITNSDEADALALAYMGAQKIGWINASGAAQYKVLDSVTWPEIPGVES